MSDVPEQTCSPCATCDTMSLPDKHYFCASDAVTDGDVTKKARVNYEQIILEVARSAGHDSDDKGLDWRTMNVMATEEKTTDVEQTLVFAGPSDIAGARGTVGGYATDETPEAMPQTQRSASCFALSSTQLGETEISAGLVPAAMSESSWDRKRTSEGAVLPEDVRHISVSARHGTDVKADQLDKDLMEYAVKLVRPVSLCTDKTSYRFGLLKVELKKENIEKKNSSALNLWTNNAAHHCQFLRHRD